jgi:hypothetical protein
MPISLPPSPMPTVTVRAGRPEQLVERAFHSVSDRPRALW